MSREVPYHQKDARYEDIRCDWNISSWKNADRRKPAIRAVFDIFASLLRY
jgi:hypothetical protein